MKFHKEAFRVLRESRGLTFEEIGQRLGVSKQSVSNWENKNTTDKPRPKRVYALAKLLGCSAVDISDLKPEPEVIQMTNNGHNVNGNNNNIGDKVVGVEIKGRNQTVSMAESSLNEKAIRADERKKERKKLQDYIMALDENKLNSATAREIYNYLNKEE